MLRKKKREKKRGKTGAAFWNREYLDASHLAISDNESEDLAKFTRWLERETGRTHLNVTTSALDLGCGNGRNLIWLSETYGMRGMGYDISEEAISYAKKKAGALPLTFLVGSLKDLVPAPDASQTLVLDMMASHVLHEEERRNLAAEVYRVLKPGGFLFFKTFLLDEDRNAARLLKEHPGSEPGTYIHPEIGVEEHVFTIPEIKDLYSVGFTIHKVHKSHQHIKNGEAFKRRSVSVYIQKDEY